MKLNCTFPFLATVLFLCFLQTQSFAQVGTGITYRDSAFTTAWPSWVPGGGHIFKNVDDSVTNVYAFPGSSFKFGGTTYSGYYISSNGWIGLTNYPAGSAPPLGTSAAASLPNNNTSGLSNLPTPIVWPGPILAPLWDDIKADSIFVKVGAGNAGITIYWINVHWDHLAPTAYTSIQVKLSLTTNAGRIQYYYKNPYGAGAYQNNSTSGASIGISDSCSGDYYSVIVSPWATGTALKSSETKTINALNTAGVLASSIIFDPSVPTNDQCAGAISLTMGSGSCTPTIGTLIGATSTGSPVAWCSGSITDTNDVWYYFSKPAGIGSFTVNTDFTPSCRPATTSVEIYPADSGCAQLSGA